MRSHKLYSPYYMDTKDKKIQRGEREREKKRQNTHTLSCKCPIHKNKADMRMPQWWKNLFPKKKKKKSFTRALSCCCNQHKFSQPAATTSRVAQWTVRAKSRFILGGKALLSARAPLVGWTWIVLAPAPKLPEGQWSHFFPKNPSAPLVGWWWMGWSWCWGRRMSLGRAVAKSPKSVSNCDWAARITHPTWRDPNPHPAPFPASWESLSGENGQHWNQKTSFHPAWAALCVTLPSPDQPPSLKITKGQLYQQKIKNK